MNGPGRRVAERPAQPARLPVLGLAVAAPLLVVLAAVAQAPGHSPDTQPTAGPASEALTTYHLACPGGGSRLLLGSASEEASGEARLRPAGSMDSTATTLRPGGYAAPAAPAGPVVVEATDGLAPGLFGSLSDVAAAPAAGECVSPVGERWFAGAGAGGFHESRLQLVNPDAGPAVADVTLWSTDGELAEVESRGLTIPPHRSTRLDLAKLAPHRDDLVMRVAVVRGRVGATVEDGYTPRRGKPATDWLAATTAPATGLLLPGLPVKASEHVLVLANPGPDEGRVAVRVTGARSTFAPAGVEEIRVPAGRVVVTDLSRSLGAALATENAAALELTATVPVAGSLRSVSNGDLVHTVGVPAEPGASAAMLAPGGGRQLVLVPWQGSGPVRVTFLGGKPSTTTAALKAGTTRALPVPAGAVGVVVRSSVPYAATLQVTSRRGAALLPLRPLVMEQSVPHVAPAAP